MDDEDKYFDKDYPFEAEPEPYDVEPYDVWASKQDDEDMGPIEKAVKAFCEAPNPEEDDMFFIRETKKNYLNGCYEVASFSAKCGLDYHGSQPYLSAAELLCKHLNGNSLDAQKLYSLFRTRYPVKCWTRGTEHMVAAYLKAIDEKQKLSQLIQELKAAHYNADRIAVVKAYAADNTRNAINILKKAIESCNNAFESALYLAYLLVNESSDFTGACKALRYFNVASVNCEADETLQAISMLLEVQIAEHELWVRYVDSPSSVTLSDVEKLQAQLQLVRTHGDALPDKFLDYLKARDIKLQWLKTVLDTSV